MKIDHLAKATWLGLDNWQRYLQSHGIKAGFTGTSEELVGSIHHVKQVHGCQIVVAGAATAPGVFQRPEADGLVTIERDRIIAVKTADCLPLLLWHPDFVMALHAGWRGFVAGILQRAFSWIKQQNHSLHSVRLMIGPAISSLAFEIGPDVKDQISSVAPWDFVLNKGKDDRWHADLQIAALAQAVSLGLPVKSMACVRSCTRFEVNSPWHSYRRDGHSAGRNWSWRR